MKKFSAILLICIFALSQYARQLNFLECKLLNTFRSATMKCDCDKMAGFKDTGKDNSSTPKVHLHIHLDEFFAAPAEVSLPSPCSLILKTPFLYRGNEPDGVYSQPWQPPNS